MPIYDKLTKLRFVDRDDLSQDVVLALIGLAEIVDEMEDGALKNKDPKTTFFANRNKAREAFNTIRKAVETSESTSTTRN